jgi:hypothetical protein
VKVGGHGGDRSGLGLFSAWLTRLLFGGASEFRSREHGFLTGFGKILSQQL